MNQTDSEGRITEPRQNGTPTSKFKQMTTFKLLSLARQIAMGMVGVHTQNFGDMSKWVYMYFQQALKCHGNTVELQYCGHSIALKVTMSGPQSTHWLGLP